MKYANINNENIFEGSILSPIKINSVTKEILDNSLIGFDDYVAEFNINLKDGCSTERSIYSMLTLAGFTLQNTGTKYLYWILITFVGEYNIPKRTKDFYERASIFFEEPIKHIEIAIKRSVENASLKQLSKINDLLGDEVVSIERPIKTGEFLTGLAAKLVMLKSHQNGKTFFTNHNYN